MPVLTNDNGRYMRISSYVHLFRMFANNLFSKWSVWTTESFKLKDVALCQMNVLNSNIAQKLPLYDKHLLYEVRVKSEAKKKAVDVL